MSTHRAEALLHCRRAEHIGGRRREAGRALLVPGDDFDKPLCAELAAAGTCLLLPRRAYTPPIISLHLPSWTGGSSAKKRLLHLRDHDHGPTSRDWGARVPHTFNRFIRFTCPSCSLTLKGPCAGTYHAASASKAPMSSLCSFRKLGAQAGAQRARGRSRV